MDQGIAVLWLSIIVELTLPGPGFDSTLYCTELKVPLRDSPMYS